eukprot:CAMPEP_0196575010 /NCGR_PEP_ID=MMETSP1081-20130531/4588_1 /TAXON_ID=36882 /ORGANISM="Pyramimonas amylifera, Strain CCMP720" /LENGTH=350 /DNA_ID=CAMNT_0041893187 /DNA_START=70 /DNA_END=1122 /DNA_ORIENTATION=-
MTFEPISYSEIASQEMDSEIINGPGPGTLLWKARRSSSTRSSEQMNCEASPVVQKFLEALESDKDMAVAVAAIKALTFTIQTSKASTMMELEKELKWSSEALRQCKPTSICLAAGCELFMRYVTRTRALEATNMQRSWQHLIDRGNMFATISLQSREKIAELGQKFVREGSVVLLHGYSRVALCVLRAAVAAGTHFSALVTEGRPDRTGTKMAEALLALGVPCTLVLDSAAAYAMEGVDMLLLGAEVVVENGGVVNKLGTFQVATVARAMGKPVYVAVESYKFARLYPLNQMDLPREESTEDLGLNLPDGLKVDNPTRDYTPPDRITLLFTDLGVFTPSAVSDELIQLYL